MKTRSIHIIFISIALIVTVGCRNLSLIKAGKETSIPAVIKNIGGDDLGRVVVFAETLERARIVFVKDIYSSTDASADVKRKMHEYIDSIKKYRGKKVIVSYWENGIGDLMITGIKKK